MPKSENIIPLPQKQEGEEHLKHIIQEYFQQIATAEELFEQYFISLTSDDILENGFDYLTTAKEEIQIALQSINQSLSLLQQTVPHSAILSYCKHKQKNLKHEADILIELLNNYTKLDNRNPEQNTTTLLRAANLLWDDIEAYKRIITVDKLSNRKKQLYRQLVRIQSQYKTPSDAIAETSHWLLSEHAERDQLISWIKEARETLIETQKNGLHLYSVQ